MGVGVGEQVLNSYISYTFFLYVNIINDLEIFFLSITIKMETIATDPIKPIDVDAAVRFYRAHLKAVSEYQRRNLEKMRTKNKDYNEKIKVHDKEKYEKYLAKK